MTNVLPWQTADWGWARALAILPDSNFITGGQDNVIRIWDSNTYKLIGSFNDINVVKALACLPNSHIVSGSFNDRNIRIWNSTTYNLVANLTGGHVSGITTLAVLPNTNNIVSGSYDYRICIWNSTSFQLIKWFIRSNLRFFNRVIWQGFVLQNTMARRSIKHI